MPNGLLIVILIFSLLVMFFVYHTSSQNKISTVDHLQTKLSDDLMVIVLSARENEKQRQVIKETWGKFYPDNTVFVVGKQFCDIPVQFRDKWFRCESNKTSNYATSPVYKSYVNNQKQFQNRLEHEEKLLMVDLVDTYWNLTKKILLSYEKILKIKPNIKWIMKADDDVFVRTDKVAEFLKLFDSQKPTVIGRLSKPHKPDLIKIKERYHDPNLHLFEENSMLPLYPKGAETYILSRPIIEYLVQNKDSFPDYHVEDIGLGRILEKSQFYKDILWLEYRRALKPMNNRNNQSLSTCAQSLNWDGYEKKNRLFHGLIFSNLEERHIFTCYKFLKTAFENKKPSLDGFSRLGHFVGEYKNRHLT